MMPKWSSWVLRPVVGIVDLALPARLLEVQQRALERLARRAPGVAPAEVVQQAVLGERARAARRRARAAASASPARRWPCSRGARWAARRSGGSSRGGRRWPPRRPPRGPCARWSGRRTRSAAAGRAGADGPARTRASCSSAPRRPGSITRATLAAMADDPHGRECGGPRAAPGRGRERITRGYRLAPAAGPLRGLAVPRALCFAVCSVSLKPYWRAKAASYAGKSASRGASRLPRSARVAYPGAGASRIPRGASRFPRSPAAAAGAEHVDGRRVAIPRSREPLYPRARATYPGARAATPGAPGAARESLTPVHAGRAASRLPRSGGLGGQAPVELRELLRAACGRRR